MPRLYVTLRQPTLILPAVSGSPSPCPYRARSGSQTRVLTVTHETDATTVTCMTPGLAGTSRSLPS